MKITEGKMRLARDTVIIFIGAILLLYIAKEYLLGAVLPFAIAFAIALFVRGVGERVAGALRLPEKITRAVIAALLVVAILALALGGGYLALLEAWQLIRSFGEGGAAGELFAKLSGFVEEKLSMLGISGELYQSITSSLSGVLGSLVGKIGGIISAVAASVPKIMLFLLVSVIATVYFSYDLERITALLKGLIPRSWSSALSRFSKGGKAALLSFLRSYLLIMALTFVMMLAGLLILRVRYALLLAVVIAIVDVLPVLGIGIILVPWGLVEIIFGNAGLGIGLLVLFGVATVVRQIAEPKIVGKNLGIHPLLSLFLMYAGYSLFGFFGLIAFPALGAVIASTASRRTIPPRSKSESDSGISDSAE